MRHKNRLTRLLIAVALGLAVTAPAAAQQTIFLVRHAEKADTKPGSTATTSTDPDLSAAGRERAESLATVLKDAGVAEVYATEFKRTQQTAAPIAKALGLTVKIVPSKNTPDLLNAVKSAKGRVLVVGHSNTLPEVIKGLGIATPVTVDDGEFDNLFVVNADGKPSLVRLRYR